ncbi:hypothetical protein ACFVYT_40635 [Streptomyces sp. NPDC058290]|uniref:hypothetical protein n=1 Tax=Streptomyces sp. NPDC058290 TaxID=3346426 RepID=UPI0036E388B7
MRSTRRTTLRTAAVLAGAATVLAVPVGSAFADSPSAPGPEVRSGVEEPATDPTGPVPPAVTPEKPEKPARAFVTTVKLADGSTAKVYKIGADHCEAEIFAGSTKLDTLVSKGGAATYGQSNGLHVVLQPNGTVTSWVDGAHKPKPEVKKESSVRITMPDGRIAKLVDGPKGKRVEISMPNGNRFGTVDLSHPSAQNDGWTYRIVQDGKRVKFVVIDGKGGGSSWVYGFDGKLIEKYTAQRVVPKGGVKAGAEGISTGDAPMPVAAGGGMAAVGAAGLGFALLKRGRADQS